MKKETVVFGALGTTKDNKGKGDNRWKEWRPTVELCTHADFPVSRYEMFYQSDYVDLANQVKTDIEHKTATHVVLNHVDFKGDPWNFESVYVAFFDFFLTYSFDPDKVDYFLNISTGTHVMQICLFLLAEAKFVPAKMVQSTWKRQIVPIDLGMERFDLIAQRFQRRAANDVAFLKDDIETKNVAYEELIERIKNVSTKFDYPILLTGNTGVGKTSLATRIHKLREQRQKKKGKFVSINCATLRGDVVRSELFGHVAHAYTGATKSKTGLLKDADGGTLFLDEIGELDLEVQKMLLTALEEKQFRPLGSNDKIESNFYFIAGTNSDLKAKVQKKEFREDLLARIDAFHFTLPDLKKRPEDIEPNLDRQIQEFSRDNDVLLTINDKAREKYLEFAMSAEATWNNNFRDLMSSVIRMGAYAENGRITVKVVEDEIERLRGRWLRTSPEFEKFPLALRFLGQEGIRSYDLIRIAELEIVLETCLKSHTAAAAGRELYNATRDKKTTTNDTDRVAKKLASFNLKWKTVKDQSR